MEQHTSKESPGNLNWKERLEDTTGLAEDIYIDKKEAWSALHNRLQKKRQRKKSLLYWAAAFLALAGSLLFLRIGKKHTVAHKHDLVKRAPAATFQKQPLLFDKAAKAGIAVFRKINKTVNPAFVATIQKSVPGDIVKKEDLLPIVINDQKDLTVIQPVVPVAVMQTQLASVLPTKKLKVTHINELGDPVEERGNQGSIAAYNPLHFGLINPEIYTSPSLSINTTGFNIFKTKNTPSN